MDLKTLIATIKEKYPQQVLMADVSNVRLVNAEKIGFDFVGTTLVGYTDYTEQQSLTELEKVMAALNIPVIAEGNIDTPEKGKKALDLGAFAVVGKLEL